MLAKQLGYSFYDLDEEVKKEFQMTLEELVHTENLRWRDQKRGRIIEKILAQKENMVFIYFDRIENLFKMPYEFEKIMC